MAVKANFKKTILTSNYIYLGILFCFFAWIYRIVKINEIIQKGFLLDFSAYYKASSALIFNNSAKDVIATTSYGPPLVLLPYIPFTLLPFTAAEYFLTFLNMMAYFFTFYLLWKRFYKKHDLFFWIYVGLMAFSFPLIFSLGMGNPVGFVTIGVYGFWIFKSSFLKFFSFIVSVLLKIFPIIIIFSFASLFKKFKVVNKISVLVFIFLLISILAVINLYSLSVWQTYYQFLKNLFRIISLNPDQTIYNQSFSSFLARLGFFVPSFSAIYWLFGFFIVMPAIYLFIFTPHHNAPFVRTWVHIKARSEIPKCPDRRVVGAGFTKRDLLVNDKLEVAILLLSLALLMHPFPWQHYFAVFLPFLMIKIGKGKLLYLAPLILISINGQNFSSLPLFKEFLFSSQFFGTFILYLLVYADIINPKFLK